MSPAAGLVVTQVVVFVVIVVIWTALDVTAVFVLTILTIKNRFSNSELKTCHDGIQILLG